ncbi:MAG: FAD-binding oxidoreductase, partial [Acidimicrobiales bacterium]
MSTSTLARELAARGRTETRPGEAGDAVGGHVPTLVVRPGDVESVAAIVGTTTAAGCSLVPRGGGTKLQWGAAPSSADVVVDLGGLNRILEHSAGDLVVRVQPGVRLADLQAALAPANQRLVIDEVVPGSTIGGVVATGLSGPRRMGYG